MTNACDPLSGELNRVIETYGLANALDALRTLVEEVADEVTDDEVKQALDAVAGHLEDASVDADGAGY